MEADTVRRKSSPLPSPRNSAVGGLWTGALWWDDGSVHSGSGLNVRAMIAETGEYRLVLYEALEQRFTGQSEQVYGTVQIDGRQLGTSESGRWLSAPDGATVTGSSWADFAMFRDIRSGESIDADFHVISNGEARFGTLSVNYHSLSENPSSLEILGGTYLTDDEVMTIDSGGAIFYQSSANGCTGSGLAEIIDPHYNMYRISVDVDGCTGNEALRNGLTFTGLASIGQNNDMSGGLLNETIEMAVSAVHTDIMGSSYMGWNLLLHED